MSEIPEWAGREACKRLHENYDQFAAGRISVGVAKGIRLAAELIAEHEEPPVDEIAEALRATFGAAAPEFVAAFKSEIAKRGLVITGADK